VGTERVVACATVSVRTGLGVCLPLVGDNFLGSQLEEPIIWKGVISRPSPDSELLLQTNSHTELPHGPDPL